MTEQTQLTTLPINEVALDLDNPRFHHLRDQNKGQLTEQLIEKEILDKDEDLPLLSKAIRKSGIKDPIWVVKRGKKYVVIEGNRRLVVLRQLVQQAVPAPDGVAYEQVPAHILDPNTSETEIVLQKARLQAGKKEWGPYNEAALTAQLREAPHLMDIGDIAVQLKIGEKEVRARIANYKLFHEYEEATGDHNPRRFAYFSECPPKVRTWYEESSKNKAEFFKLISPTSGRFNKIRSVATRGGLRDFQQVIEDPEALKLLITDPQTSVEDALEIAKDNNITKGMPFVKKILPMAMSLRSLDTEKVEKLKAEPRFKAELRSLHSACADLMAKLDE